MDLLKPLKMATKRLEGRGKEGRYGANAENIPVFEYLLSYYEERVKTYDAVNFNAHEEAPEDHLAINIRAAWAKINEYYAKLDLSPAYYAATILHPRYKTYCDVAWADKPKWLDANNRAFRALWAEYNTSPCPTRRPQVIPNDIDDAIEALIDPRANYSPKMGDLDEFEKWKSCEPRVEKNSDAVNSPIKYWLGLRDRYPNLA